MKKNILIFIGGFICGIVSTILFLAVLGAASGTDTLSGLNISDEKGECITYNNATVLQPLTPKATLANIRVKKSYGFINDGVMLLLSDNEKMFYDNEEIKLPKGKCFRQKGVYQYENRDHIKLTVPAVKID